MYLYALAAVQAPHRFRQPDCWELFRQTPAAQRLRPRSLEVLEKVLMGDNGVAERAFCTADLPRLWSLDAGGLAAYFEASAPALAAAAVEDAQARAGRAGGDLDALFLCTCTGYLCPSPSSFVAERLGVRGDAYLCDLVGLGCGAAVPALRAASHFLAAHPEARVAVVAVEVCSAAFYMDDDVGVLISACLFGDGAAAVIVGAKPPASGPALRFGEFDTLHRPELRERLRFVNAGGKLRNRLHRTVPQVAAAAVGDLYRRRAAVPPGERVVPHAGGRDVLEALEPVLPGHDFGPTRAVLRRAGNLSSPSVLCALDECLRTHGPAAPRWLVTFGAGFSAHSCALAPVPAG